MPKIEYRPQRFQAKSLAVITQAEEIARAYLAQGYSLTLRQLYYQFVSRGLIANKDTEYERLGSILNDARMAGLFDWSWITDRTRNVRGGDGSMTNPAQVINEWAFAMALWEGQPERVEVWVEKDALVDVVGRAAGGLRVPYFSCRGYTSVSELWAAAQRIESYFDDGIVEKVTILHLGDHDPSGLDMTRDIRDRMTTFLEGDGYYGEFNVERIALNMDQVRQYNPPPNPAKLTDSRGTGYVARYGSSSWELDALEPTVLDALIRQEISGMLVSDLWEERRKLEAAKRGTLKTIRDHYDRVITFLEGEGLLEPAEEAEDATDDD